MSRPTHTWRFFRAGGFDQVKLETGADLLNLDQLDQKLWTALACPVTGLKFDQKTLSLIDSDKDGRVRAPELIAAIQWAGSVLKNPDDLVKNAGSDSLSVSALNDATPEGKALASSVRSILNNLGKKDATAISLADTADTARIFAQTAFNGDGVIVPESAGANPSVKQLIQDVLETQGSVPDRSGKPGVDASRIEKFLADCAAFDEWAKKSETNAPTILPLGDKTGAANAAYTAAKAKVEDYFGRCRLAAYDPRAIALLNRKEDEYLAVAASDMSLTAQEVNRFPLAQVAAGKPLPLRSGLNPAWADTVNSLVNDAVKPMLGDRAELSENDWATLSAKLAPYGAWLGSKAGVSVEKLGIARVRAILAGSPQAALDVLVAQDQAEEGNVNAVAGVDRLLHYQRDLHKLCVNFVSFKDLYDRSEPAIFQAGTLFLDQRSCTLCLHVEDVGKHAAMAAMAGTYLAYCDCVRRGSGEKLSIVAAFTDGNSDNLMVGRNGIFYDRKGRDYDATITKIIENPISLREAFWWPYKKFVRLIESLISKRAAAADAASSNKMAAAAETHANADKAAAAPAPPKIDVGTVAAIGVAFGAIGTFLTALVGHLIGVLAWGIYGIVGAVIGVILLISGPSMVLAFIKLRKRNLGPILDANGWAVNSSAKVNVPFGKTLTGVAKLPPGSQFDTTDPFAEKRRPWGFYIFLLVVLFGLYKWWHGDLNTVLPEKLGNHQVSGSLAPGPQAPAPVAVPETVPATTPSK